MMEVRMTSGLGEQTSQVQNISRVLERSSIVMIALAHPYTSQLHLVPFLTKVRHRVSQQ